MPTSDEFTLKEILQLELARIRLEMQRMNEKMDKLVTVDRFESGMHRVSRLEEEVSGRDGLDDRVTHLASTIGAWKYVAGLAVAGLLALIVAWIKTTLGI